MLRKLIENFGAECFIDGKLNTKYLAEKVFNLPDRMRKLIQLFIPPQLNYIRKEIQIILHKNHNIVFVESALIFEAKMEDLFEYILLVTR